MNSTFEVSVPRKDGNRKNIVLGNRLVYLLGKWTGVADAGSASVPHQVEPELVKIGCKSCKIEITGDHF